MKEEHFHLDENEPIIDQLINKNGYQKPQIISIIYTALTIAVEGMHITLFQSMLLPFIDYYSLTSNDIKLVSGLFFLSIGFGSLFSGQLSIAFSRRETCIICMLLLVCAHILMAFNTYFALFIVLRLIIGFTIGVCIPLITNSLCETLPLEHRAFWMNSVWVAFPCGYVFPSVVMLFTMPNFEKEGLQKTLLILAFLPLVCYIMLTIFLRNNPKVEILKNKEKHAIDYLEKVYNTKFSPELQETLISQVKVKHESLTSEITELFHEKNRNLTVLSMIIWFNNSMILYGPVLILTLVLRQIQAAESPDNSNNTKATTQNIIYSQILVICLNAPGYILSGILSEIKKIGRIRTIIVGYLLFILFVSIALLDLSWFSIMIGLAGSSTHIFFITSGTYSSEAYSTRIRDTAVGFLYFVTRFGGFISQFLFLNLIEFGLFVPYFFVIGLCFLCILCSYLLPFETHGLPLDHIN